jgi:tight adherence protein C
MPGVWGNMTIASLLAAFAAFAAVIALAMPSERVPQFATRLKKVARERSRLRRARLAELSALPKAKVRIEAHSFAKFIARTLKVGNLLRSDELVVRLRMAGLRGPTPLAVFLFLRAALPLALFTITFAMGMMRPENPSSRAFLTALIAGAIGFGLPRLVLNRLIGRRQRAILRAFPDALDLLLICVQSGMSVEAALAKVTKDIACQSIELAEELSLTMAELAFLPSRGRAYHNLGERTGLPAIKLIAAALAQAERHGTSIGQALFAAARECRETQINDAERKAAALPAKLTVPLATFFLPILLVIILGPAAIKIAAVLNDSSNGNYFKNPPTQLQEPRNSQMDAPPASAQNSLQ